jgi:hypothetical protein
VDYFIDRDGQKFGPYTLSDLQRYVASGEVLLSDIASSEGMTDPVPVAQIIGTIAAPPAFSHNGPVSVASIYPDPPNLHWGLVLLFGTITCGLFSVVWDIVQAAWLRRVEPQSKSLYLYCGAAGALVLLFTSSFLSAIDHTPADAFTSILKLVYYVILLVARFNFRSSMEDHFNGPEPMGLNLSGVMTFFFGDIYFQYHINDIVRRKAEDRIWEAAR